MTAWRLAGCAAAAMAFLSASAQSRIEPVPYRSVTLTDSFWAPRQKKLDSTTLPEQFRMLDEHKYRQNFERAAARLRGGYEGFVFNDSDVYKVLEAASYSLGRNPNQPELVKKVDGWIDLIARAQEPDGYLDTHFQLMEPERKWSNLRDQHELYCAGHLFEAAAAHYEATGSKALLAVAVKLADLIDSRFGPGKKMGYPGHPEAELALFKLWKATGDRKYYKLSEFFLNSRGSKWFATEHGTPLSEYKGDYWSDNLPIRDHEQIVGHAVRAAYLFCGAADLARETGDRALTAMLDRVWTSNTEKRMFVTGGIGPSGSNEGFTVDYDLPTFTAYQESCAGIANALWNWRMGLLHGAAKPLDVMETALYNGAISGISADGDCYFYTNPLASEGGHHRQEWHACACCPPNLARLIGEVGGMAYAASPDAVYVNLFINGKARIRQGGQDVDLTVRTGYPWSGGVEVKVDRASAKPFAFKLRVPGWVGPSGPKAGPDGYYTTEPRVWKTGDTVKLDLPMPVMRIISHPSVKDTLGMTAFQRGPVVYCAEKADNSFDFGSLGIPLEEKVEAQQAVDRKLGRIVVLRTTGFVMPSSEWSHRLFQPLPAPKSVAVRLIPYALWDNREPGPMRVWFSPSPAPAPLRGLEKEAKVSLSYTSGNCDPEGINDGFVPAGSSPNSPQQTHFWPHKGGEEWAEYSFASEKSISSARVYWFDDTGRGECRLPASWRLEWWTGSAWQAVELKGGYGLKLDQWNEADFKPVTTSRIRLVLNQQEGWASGIHEWQVFP